MSGHIAFTIYNSLYADKPGYDSYVTAISGASRQLVAPRRRQPQYAPDGAHLLAMGMEPDHEKLYVRDLVNGSERAIDNTPLETMDASWAPDGNSVVYSSNELDDRQSRLYVVDSRVAPDSRRWLKFGAIDLIGRYPTWLGNGQIVYSGCDKWGGSGQCGIARVNPDGAAPVMLTGNDRDGVDVAPSGRGNTVVFMSHRDGNWEVYSVPLSGGEAKNLSNSPSEDGLPTLSPDGQFVAFVSNRSGQWAMWAMKTDGSGQRMLFNLDGGYGVGGTVDWTTERISWGP
jgi:TolB protein